MQVSLNHIPVSVRLAAANLLDQQSLVPLSPLIRDNQGNVLFCSAAAIAISNANNDEDRKALIQRMDISGSECLPEILEEFGWPAHVARAVLMNNDSHTSDKRKREVINMIRNLYSITHNIIL